MKNKNKNEELAIHFSETISFGNTSNLKFAFDKNLKKKKHYTFITKRQVEASISVHSLSQITVIGRSEAFNTVSNDLIGGSHKRRNSQNPTLN